MKQAALVPGHSQILILNIPRSPVQATPEGGSRLGYLRFLLISLRLFGFRFTTPTTALARHQGRFVCLVFEGEGRELYQILFPWLARRRIPATLIMGTGDVCTKFDGQSQKLMMSTPTRMTWKNLRHLLRKGWEIGTYGVGSLGDVNLTQLAHAEQKRYISESYRILAERLGQPPQIFAYPGGAYCTSSTKYVREEGFAVALTREPVRNNRESARFHLGRLTLSGRIINDMVQIIRCLAAPPKSARIKGLGTSRETLAAQREAQAGRGKLKAGAIP